MFFVQLAKIEKSEKKGLQKVKKVLDYYQEDGTTSQNKGKGEQMFAKVTNYDKKRNFKKG